jgi:hypothetical protein
VAAEVSNTANLVAEIGPAGQPRGVLNASLWKDQLFTVDYSRHRLRIDPGALAEADGKTIFPLEAATGDLVVPLTVSGQALACRVEPEISYGLLVPAEYFPRVETQTTTRTASKIQLNGAAIAGQEARVTTKAAIAAFDFERPYVFFGNIGDRAILGNRWLLEFALTYDLAARRVRLARVPKS